MKEPIHSGKVSEAALSRSIAVSVIGILLCMICLVGTTWAWYSLSVESGSSDMTGANFDFTVVVTKTVISTETNGETGGENTDPTEITVPVEPDNGYYTVENEENAIYRVTLTKTGTATKGFCLITVKEQDADAGTSYYVTIPEAGYITLTITGQHSLKFTPVLGIKTENELPGWMSSGTEPAAVGFNQKKEDQIAADPDDEVTGEGKTSPKSETQPDETGSPTDGETGTSEGNTTEGGQIPPDAVETPSGGTPENSEPPDETTTEPISESTTKQPEETSTETTTQN